MNQSGYVVYSLVFVLSVLALSGIGLQAQHKIVFDVSRHDELQQVRQALVAYAIDYQQNYGPRGAGPGHLPCPDTDMPAGSFFTGWEDEGPNPPCGKHQWATGLLPRHVLLDHNGRFSFQSTATGRYAYMVSAAFVNNPLNRSVNPDTQGESVTGDNNRAGRVHLDDVVALVSRMGPGIDMPALASPGSPSRHLALHLEQKTSGGTAIVYSRDILEPLRYVVGRWLQQQLQFAAQARCPGSEPGCRPYAVYSNACQSSPPTELRLWLLKHFVSDPGCEQLADSVHRAFRSVEGVAATQHWFFRNGWPAFTGLEIDPECVVAPIDACVFNAHVLSGDDMLLMTLRRTVVRQ